MFLKYFIFIFVEIKFINIMKTTVLTVLKEDEQAFKDACRQLQVNIQYQDELDFTVNYNFDYTLFNLGQLTQVKSFKNRI